MHAQQMQRTVPPRTVQSQVQAYNDALDGLAFWQRKVQQLRYEMVMRGIYVCTCEDDPYHVRLSEYRKG